MRVFVWYFVRAMYKLFNWKVLEQKLFWKTWAAYQLTILLKTHIQTQSQQGKNGIYGGQHQNFCCPFVCVDDDDVEAVLKRIISNEKNAETTTTTIISATTTRPYNKQYSQSAWHKSLWMMNVTDIPTWTWTKRDNCFRIRCKAMNVTWICVAIDSTNNNNYNNKHIVQS